MSYANEWMDEIVEIIGNLEKERDELRQTVEQFRVTFFRLKLENQILRLAFNRARAGNDDTLDKLDEMKKHIAEITLEYEHE